MSSRCTATKKDGSQCTSQARENETLCPYHWKLQSNKIAKTKKPGDEYNISKDKKLTFQQFYEKENVLELQSEVAYLRTLLVELREIIDLDRQAQREEMLHNFEVRAQHILREIIPENEVEEVAEDLKSEMGQVLEAFVGPMEPMTIDDIVEIRKHIESISKVAEKAKKIKDGFVLTVDTTNVSPLLNVIVSQIILPNVKDRVSRSNIAESFRQFSMSKKMGALTGEVLDV